MKTFFDKTNQEEFEKRLEKLTVETICKWGKMNSAQMLAHCTAAMQVPVGELTLKRSPLGLIGWMFKGMIHSDKPFSKNGPTAPEFIVADQRDFDKEKARFTTTFQKLAQGPANVKCHKHAFWGKMSDQDWGCLMYKHIDHHFQQFGI